jgi:hypothetical protein
MADDDRGLAGVKILVGVVAAAIAVDAQRGEAQKSGAATDEWPETPDALHDTLRRSAAETAPQE